MTELAAWGFYQENPLTKVELPSNVVNTITLDGEGKRRSIEDSAGLRNILWDAENILAETDSGNSTVAQYTLAPEAYGELVSQRRSGATSFHHFDALGSTNKLSDSGENTVVEYLHRAFGQQTVVSGSSANPFTWVGKLGYYRQSDASDYWIRARIMKPATGRWLNRDQIAIEGDLYRYVRNSPIRYVDPTGTRVATGRGKEEQSECHFLCMLVCEGLMCCCSWWNIICKILCRRACHALCKEQCKEYGPPWGECKKVPESKCVGCCNRVCGRSQVCLAPCIKWCAGHYPEL